MTFAKGKSKPANSGRRKGTPNKGSERARRLVSEAADAAIVKKVIADARSGADPEARRLYFRYLRPPSPRTLGAPLDLEPPNSAEEARGDRQNHLDDRQD